MHLSKILVLLTISIVLTSATEAATTLPALNTKETLGKVESVEIEAVVQGPAAQATPLQIACLFEYTAGDITTSPPALPKELNGMLHLDQALNGLITEIRKSNKFEGKYLETLLITPPAEAISAKKLLLIGLGNRQDFKAEIMRMVGVTGMREALRLGVSSYSHASDIKDAGVESPTAEVAGYVIQGAIEAYRTQLFLKQQNASDPLTVTKVSLLTGPAYFEDSKKGVKKVINTLSDK